MPFESRRPEGRKVEKHASLGTFAKVSELTAPSAGFRVRRILGSSFGPGKRLLDVGTGPGSIPVTLGKHHRGSKIFGLDLSLNMLRIAQNLCRKKSLEIPLMAGDGAFLPLRTNSLDVLTCFFSLHHMEYPARFLVEAERVLKPGGTLLVIDFRRDMAAGLFVLINLFWQLIFLFSSARHGFRDSVKSSWKPEEIGEIIRREGIEKFQVLTNHLELWIRERHGQR